MEFQLIIMFSVEDPTILYRGVEIIDKICGSGGEIKAKSINDKLPKASHFMHLTLGETWNSFSCQMKSCSFIENPVNLMFLLLIMIILIKHT